MTDVDKGALLEILFGDVVNKVKEDAGKQLDEIAKRIEKRSEDIESKAKDSLDKLDALLNNKPLVVNFGSINTPKNVVTHKVFPTIIKILESSKRKEKNIMLVGGAGGGKTHLVKQVADAMHLDFYPMSVGLQTTKSDLLGFINATGNYVTSPVRQAYENGGVLLLDEFDAAHAGVVTILNSLLANWHASFPDKIVEKNDKFVCICACNTYGRGANIDYVGRNRLDGATLDRFIVVDVDYDENLEKALANNDSWTDVVAKIRKNAEKQGIKMIISPRASIDGADLLDAGFTARQVLEMVILKGCDEDVEKKLLEDVSLQSVKAQRTRKKSQAEPATSISVGTKISTTQLQAQINEMDYIELNFDDKTYIANIELDKMSLESKESGLALFDIYVGEKYNPTVNMGCIFLNKGSGSLLPSLDNTAIECFIEDLRKNGGKQLLARKLMLVVKYKGETIMSSWGGK